MNLEKTFVLNESESLEVVNGLKYHYFGKAYFIDNSKISLYKKRKKFLLLLREVENDTLLNVVPLKKVKESIISIIYDKLKNVEYMISLNNNKFLFKFMQR